MVFKGRPRGYRGFTLTELAIVLGIIGSITGAIWLAAGYVFGVSNTNDVQADITQITNNYIALYLQHGVDTPNPTSPAVGTDVTCLGVNAGLFPAKTLTQQPCSSLTASTSYPRTPYGSQTYFAVYSRPEPPAVIIGAFGLTQTQCIYLATMLFPSPNIIWQEIGTTSRWLSIVATQNSMNTTLINSNCAGGNSVQVMYQVRG